MIRTTTLLALAGLLAAAEPVAVNPPRTLTLAEAVQLSAATAPVGIAKLEAAIARAGYGSERSALLPRISATGGLTRQAGRQTIGDDSIHVPAYNDFDAQLHLGQAILDLESWYRTKSADRQLAAAEAGSTVAIEEAAAGAGDAYVTLASAQALVAVRRDDLKLAEDLLTQAKAQVDAGATESIAATRAANRVETARSALVTAEGQVRRASIGLARALDLEPGLPLTAGEALADTLAATGLPSDADAAERTALKVRPELRVSQETLLALEAARKAAEGAGLPKLEGFADGGQGGPRLDDTDTTWRVGLGLTIPLIDGSSYRTEQASLRAAQQRLRLRQVDDRIKAEVREALTVIETAQSRLVSDRSRNQLAKDELKQAEARFSAGAAGNLEVIDAQRGLTAAQESLVGSTEALIQARVRLAKAIGSAKDIR